MSSFSAAEPTTVPARPNITSIEQRSVVTSTLNPSDINGALMWGQPVMVAYESKDLSLFVPAAPSSSIATPVDHDGMATGTKVGIGIGVSLGCVLVIAIVGFLLLRRRSKQMRPGSSGSQRAEMMLRPYGKHQKHRGDAKFAADGVESQLSEMPVRTPSPVELEGERQSIPGSQLLR